MTKEMAKKLAGYCNKITIGLIHDWTNDGVQWEVVTVKGEEWVEKTFLPNTSFASEKGKKEVRAKFSVPFMYEGSGEAYSQDIRVFNVPGGSWVYRFMDLDL